MSLFYALFLLSAAFLSTNANDCSGQALPKAKEETEMLDGNARNALPPYRGIKKEIGVENFDNAGGINGLFPLGLNLAALLKSALIDTERFVVLDRQNLNSVMREQDLQASGRAAKPAMLPKSEKFALLATWLVAQFQKSPTTAQEEEVQWVSQPPLGLFL